MDATGLPIRCFQIFSKPVYYFRMKPRIRPKVRKSASKTEDDFYLTPGSIIDAPVKIVRKATPRRHQRKLDTASNAALQQPFLPGLSRRGRPRLKNPVPATERAAASRRKRVEAGTRRIELMLPPEVTAMLDALTEHFKESRAELVTRLLTRAAKRLPRQR